MVLRTNVGAVATYTANPKLAACSFPEIPNHRAVSPSLNGLREQGVIVPNHRPHLAVIHEFLKLHGRHRTTPLQNELSNV
jgi:hypothetical protein